MQGVTWFVWCFRNWIRLGCSLSAPPASVFQQARSGQGDEGESVGLAVLQTIDSYGIDLYGQFRWYSLDRAVGPSFDDISAFTAGARWAF